MTPLEWLSLSLILLVALIGGYFPLVRRDLAITEEGFPLGQAFTAGVFLSLSLVIMAPNGLALLSKAFPGAHYPLAMPIVLVAFIGLLALGHIAQAKREGYAERIELSTAAVPVIMTVMIAIPSFLLGTALSVSGATGQIVILIAILAHKGSAGFALALSMVRSSLSNRQAYLLYGVFACSTPLGIVFGADIHEYLSGHVMTVVKGGILSLASGVFLYMGTLHEMKHSPLIINICTVRGFVVMVLGAAITALVPLLLGSSHAGPH